MAMSGNAPMRGRPSMVIPKNRPRQSQSWQTGLPEADAATRVETVATEYRNAVTAAQEAAEKACKFALLLAFAVAATLAVSAGIAWWAAVQGGEHRDQNFDLRPYIGWSRVPFRGRS